MIADNASALAATLPGVELLRLERKGRGRALRAAWSISEARVVAGTPQSPPPPEPPLH